MSNHNLHILVTGGAGYIGSHTCVELLKIGCDVTIIDNLSNSHVQSLKSVAEITGKKFRFFQVDLRNKEELETIFTESKQKIDAVIHSAALKSIEESKENPLLYYNNNVTGTLNLLEVMEDHGCRNMVFSSSAHVYGGTPPFTETSETTPNSVYGRTKLHVEQILSDLVLSNDSWKVVVLRYFNPVGCHKLLPEHSKGVSGNIVPYLMNVGIGKFPQFDLFGTDYPTPDGTSVQDYVHVVDLAKGHVSALSGLVMDNVFESKKYAVFNLGTGKGTSVLELINEFVKVSGKKINVNSVKRSDADVASAYVDASKAKTVLRWETNHDLHKMVEDSWNSLNPT